MHRPDLSLLRRLSAGIGLSLASAALCAAPPARPDPLNAGTAVPPARHISAFAGYRPLTEQPTGSWPGVNEAARQAGGWRAYARQKLAAPDTPAAAPDTPAAVPNAPAAVPNAPAAAPPAHHHH